MPIQVFPQVQVPRSITEVILIFSKGPFLPLFLSPNLNINRETSSVKSLVYGSISSPHVFTWPLNGDFSTLVMSLKKPGELKKNHRS